MANKPFRSNFKVHFREADPGGIMFFAHVYQLAHDTFEEFVEHLGYAHDEWFSNPRWGTPIRHSEAQHLRPFLAGQRYRIAVHVERVGKSSFTLRYQFTGKGAAKDELHADLTLVHTFVSLSTHRPSSIPEKIRLRLEAYRAKCTKPIEFT